MIYKSVMTKLTPFGEPTLFSVIETRTDQTIVKDVTSSAARQIARHLNLGGGFDGFTPQFFLNRLVVTGE